MESYVVVFYISFNKSTYIYAHSKGKEKKKEIEKRIDMEIIQKRIEVDYNQHRYYRNSNKIIIINILKGRIFTQMVLNSCIYFKLKQNSDYILFFLFNALSSLLHFFQARAYKCIILLIFLFCFSALHHIVVVDS